MLNGSKLNDAKGFFHITDLSMKSSEKSYELDDLQIQTGFDEQTHYMLMNSDFAQVEIRGDFDYQTLTQSLHQLPRQSDADPSGSSSG